MTLTLAPILRRRLLLVAGLLLTVWLSWKVGTDDGVDELVAARPATTKRQARQPAPPVRSDFNLTWPSRAEPDKAVSDVFELPLPPARAGSMSQVSAVPVVPPLKLKYMGRLDGADSSHVFLADDKDKVILAAIGQQLTDGWLLESMDSNRIVFRHSFSNQEQTMMIRAVQ